MRVNRKHRSLSNSYTFATCRCVNAVRTALSDKSDKSDKSDRFGVPRGLRAVTLLIPAVACGRYGAALCRTGQTSRTGRTDLMCRYNSAFIPELAESCLFADNARYTPAACGLYGAALYRTSRTSRTDLMCRKTDYESNQLQNLQ